MRFPHCTGCHLTAKYMQCIIAGIKQLIGECNNNRCVGLRNHNHNSESELCSHITNSSTNISEKLDSLYSLYTNKNISLHAALKFKISAVTVISTGINMKIMCQVPKAVSKNLVFQNRVTCIYTLLYNHQHHFKRTIQDGAVVWYRG